MVRLGPSSDVASESVLVNGEHFQQLLGQNIWKMGFSWKVLDEHNSHELQPKWPVCEYRAPNVICLVMKHYWTWLLFLCCSCSLTPRALSGARCIAMTRLEFVEWLFQKTHEGHQCGICQRASWALDECPMGPVLSKSQAWEPMGQSPERFWEALSAGARGRRHWHLAGSTSAIVRKRVLPGHLKNNHSIPNVLSTLSTMEPLFPNFQANCFFLLISTLEGGLDSPCCQKCPCFQIQTPKQQCGCSLSWSVQSNRKCQPGWWFLIECDFLC